MSETASGFPSPETLYKHSKPLKNSYDYLYPCTKEKGNPSDRRPAGAQLHFFSLLSSHHHSEHAY